MVAMASMATTVPTAVLIPTINPKPTLILALVAALVPIATA